LSSGEATTGVSPVTVLTPRRDDMSVISFADESARADPHLNQKFEETLQTAFDIMQTKSLKKALDYLIACNFLTPSPRDISSFLRLYQTRIDTSVLGDYLGEGGTDGDEVERFNLIRFHYTSAISFVGMNVEQG
jgi:Sec7-like guanine-nucleotide exchange factor